MLARALVGEITRPPWPGLALASLSGWIVLGLGGRALAIPALCGDISADAGLRAALATNGPAALTWSWSAMLLAMLPLLVAGPVRRVWRSSLPRRRTRAVAAFLAGYGGVWLLAGVGLTAAAMVLSVALGGLALAVAAALALAWRLSPLHRICLVRGHRAPALRAFGLAADVDSLRYGAASGVWCLGTCWALMLAALTAGNWHLAVMAGAVALALRDQRLAQRSPRWASAFA